MREAGLAELVRLGANESAFGTSPAAVEAMREQLDHLWWYGDPDSYELRAEIASRHGVTIDRVVVTSGIDDAMGLVVRAFMPPGGSALTTRGSYPTFNYHITGYGGRLLTADYTADGRLDFEALLDVTRREGPQIVYVANPDNPSGTFAPRADVEAFYRALPDDVLLLLDEAYGDFVDASETLEDVDVDNLIRTRTFSKAYGMAGARIGYAITSASNAATFQKIRLHFGVNRNAQVGALASLRDDAFHHGVVAAVAQGREQYYALGERVGTPVLRSFTNFVCFDLGSLERANAAMAALLRRGVWVRKPGAPPLDRFIRVTVGTPPMRDAFAEAFTAVLKEDL